MSRNDIPDTKCNKNRKKKKRKQPNIDIREENESSDLGGSNTALLPLQEKHDNNHDKHQEAPEKDHNKVQDHDKLEKDQDKLQDVKVTVGSDSDNKDDDAEDLWKVLGATKVKHENTPVKRALPDWIVNHDVIDTDFTNTFSFDDLDEVIVPAVQDVLKSMNITSLFPSKLLLYCT